MINNSNVRQQIVDALDAYAKVGQFIPSLTGWDDSQHSVADTRPLKVNQLLFLKKKM